MIRERVFRLTPPRIIFSYLPEILRKIGVKIEKNEEKMVNGRFKGVVEGVKKDGDETYIRILLQGVREPWSHIGGNFLPSVLTTHVVAETQQLVEGAGQDTEDSIRLLKQFNSEISLYVWHTSG